MYIYISRTEHCLYYLDKDKVLREIPLGLQREVMSHMVDTKQGIVSVIKGRKFLPSHNRVVRKHLLIMDKKGEE